MSWGERWFLLILVELLTIVLGERWFLLLLMELLTIIQWVEMRGDFCWYWWNCWHHSMSWGERWFLLILVELLTITQWVKVRGDFCWYWWNCWPSLNELRWEVIFVDIGGIVDHHSMSWGERWFLLILVELLTITQWPYWWNCWPSLNELRWEVIVVDIGGIVDHHSMSWGERWFLLILVELLTITQWVEGERWFLLILVELLTITQWVEGERWFLLILVELLTSLNELMVRGDFCWYWWNCWPSLNELRWEVIFVDIGGIVDHHSMSWSERWFLLILVKLLTITQWVEVRGDFCWYWWNCWPSLNELRWEVMFVDIGGIVDHHSMSWGERWFLLILVELLTSLNELKWEVIFVDIGGIVDHHSMIEVRCDFCWYWWNCWPSFNELKWEVIFVDIGGIVDHHSMSWYERWFLLILVELLTITQWVKVRGDFCWYWWNCWPSFNELRWEVMFADIGGIVDHHPMSWGERWFLLILVELLTITQCIEVRGDFCWYWWNCWRHSMSWSERWFLLILVELLTITQWVEVRGDFCWYWWNCWPSLNELIGERWFLLILVELLTITQWVEVRGDFCWYWWNCWPSLNELRWEVIFVDIGGIVDHHSMS